MTTLIIDSDSVVYAVAFASQDWAVVDEEHNIIDVCSLKSDAKKIAEEDSNLSVSTLPRPEVEVRQSTDSFIENIIDNHEDVDEVVVWLTAPDVKKNFRYSISEDYKANRKDFEKPYHYETVRDHLIREWGAKISREGWEADDELSAAGWHHYKCGKATEPVYLCSIDKDLDTVPGLHYRWPTHNKEGANYFLSEDQAVHNYWVQVLTGDNADNIKGLHRVGEKRAGSFLSSCKSELDYYNTCKKYWVAHLEKEGFSEEEAVEQMHTTCKLLYLMKGENDTGWRPPT